jgi:hypothetical protein
MLGPTAGRKQPKSLRSQKASVGASNSKFWQSGAKIYLNVPVRLSILRSTALQERSNSTKRFFRDRATQPSPQKGAVVRARLILDLVPPWPFLLAGVSKAVNNEDTLRPGAEAKMVETPAQ